MYKVNLSNPAARDCAAKLLRATRDPRFSRVEVMGNAIHAARMCAENDRIAGNFAGRKAYLAAADAISEVTPFN